MMWLILLVQRQVNLTFRAVFCGCGYESVALFQRNRALRKPLIQMDGFYAKETKYSPTTVHFKDYGAVDACGGFNAVWINSLRDTFWILMWSQRSETFPPGLVLWRLTETGFWGGRGEETHSWTGSLMDLLSRHNRKWIDARDSELFLTWSSFYAHPSPYKVKSQ